MLRHLSASGVHRCASNSNSSLSVSAVAPAIAKVKAGGSIGRKGCLGKWSDFEMDLARFLAKQCGERR